jgi:hypothetical protein
MKKLKRHSSIPLFLLISLTLWQCESTTPTRPNTIWQKEANRQTNLSVQQGTYLKLQNYYGGLIIYGHSVTDKINISATCKAESPDRDKLDNMLAGIQFPARQIGDTLFVNVTAPVAKRYEKYRCGLNLLIPYHMPVYIDYSHGAIITNELDSLVHVRRAQSRILLARHQGSADLQAQSHINLELYKMWPHAFINAVTDSGDVNIVFPENADVSILARSFYHPIELINFELPTYLQSYYTAEGVRGSGDASINLKTTYGTVRLKVD